MPPLWQPGDVILGIYEVRDVHTGGGMSLVYRVWHRGWKTELAVKRPRPELFRGDRYKAYFEREAATWVQLGLHPHIVSCYYVRRLDELPYLFAEYLSGGSLSRWIRKGYLYRGGTTAAAARVLDVAIQTAWGLAHAHDARLVHQDVKPANVLLTRRGTAKVTDFGLARAFAAVEEESDAPPSATGLEQTARSVVTWGGLTPAFCSIEQSRRKPLSPATDVWSWGLTVLEMYVGEVTWVNGSVAPESLEAYLATGANREGVPVMPGPIADLLRGCFQIDPERRPGSFHDIADELLNIYKQTSGKAYPRRPPLPAEARADHLNNRAVSLLDLGKPVEAEALWRQALVTEPRHLESSYNLNLFRWRTNDLNEEEVVRQMRQVCASHLGESRPACLLARLHMEWADYEGALALIAALPESERHGEEVEALHAEAAEAHHQASHPFRALENDGHRKLVSSLALNADGTRLLSGSWDQLCKVWDTSGGICLNDLAGHEDAVASVAWSPDGLLALTGGHDRRAILWDLANGQPLLTLSGHEEQVSSVCFGPQPDLILTGGWDGSVRIWDRKTGRCLQVLSTCSPRVTAVFPTADDRLFLSASTEIQGHETTLELWDPVTGQRLRQLQHQPFQLVGLSVSRTSPLVLTGCSSGALRLWSWKTDRCLVELNAGAWITAVALLPDGRHALTGDRDGNVKWWDLERRSCRRTIPLLQAVSCLAISGDGKVSAVGTVGRAIQLCRFPAPGGSPHVLCRLSDGEEEQTVQVKYNQALVSAREALADDDYALAADHLRTARSLPGRNRAPEAVTLWAKLYVSLGRSALQGNWEVHTLAGHRASVHSLDIGPDSRTLVSGSGDHTIRLWDLDDGSCPRILRGHKKAVCSVRFSADGKYIASASKDRTVRLWNAATGECVQSFLGHENTVHSACLTPDHATLISGSWDGTVRTWETSSGRCTRILEGCPATQRSLLGALRSLVGPKRIRLPGQQAAVHAVHAGSVRRQVLSAGQGPAVFLWDLGSGQILHVLEGHSDAVWSVCLSGDGTMALSAGSDQSICLWQTRNGRLVESWKAHRDTIRTVCFSSDDRFILSGSSDRTARLWRVSNRRCVHTFEGHADRVDAVGMSADGRYAVTASGDKVLKVWFLDWELDDEG